MYVITPRNRVVLPPSSTPAFNFTASTYGTPLLELDLQRTSSRTIDNTSGRDSVATWNDYQGSGRDFSATKIQQPTYLATGNINGKPTAYFQSANAYRLNGNATALNTYNNRTGVTQFAVFRVRALPATEGRILSGMQNSNINNSLQTMTLRSTPAFRVGEKLRGTDSFVALDAGTPVVNTNYILCSVVDATNGDIYSYLNKTLLGSNTSWQSPGNFEALDLSEFTIGGRNTVNDRYIDAEIGHILIYDGVLSSTNRDACFDALNQWWGTIY